MLTPAQLEERKKGIGSSDAPKIASGEWYELWLDKTGRSEPKAILSPWDTLLRHYIEPAIMDFYQLTYSCQITQRGAAVVCAKHPILRATLDGFDAADGRVVDAKLLNTFTKDPYAWASEHYGWQMVHQMTVMGCQKGSLSVSIGMAKPVRLDWTYDEFEALTYIDRCKKFWAFVETDTPPPGAPEPAPPPMPIADMRTVDMTKHKKANEWGNEAAIWLANVDAVAKHKTATEALKAMVERDVKLATGNGIEITRDGRGLSIKKEEKTDK